MTLVGIALRRSKRTSISARPPAISSVSESAAKDNASGNVALPARRMQGAFARMIEADGNDRDDILRRRFFNGLSRRCGREIRR